MSQTVSISLLSSPIILKFIFFLTKPACPNARFLEHQVCRMLIDVTWKKGFESNRFLYCWDFYSDSLVCDVNIQEENLALINLILRFSYLFPSSLLFFLLPLPPSFLYFCHPLFLLSFLSFLLISLSLLLTKFIIIIIIN